MLSDQLNRRASCGVRASWLLSVMASRSYKSPSLSVRILWLCFIRETRSVYRVTSVDELVSLDELQEKIAEFEDYVQSSDVAAMQSTRDVYSIAL